MNLIKYYVLQAIGWVAFMVALGFILRIAFFFGNIGWGLLD